LQTLTLAVAMMVSFAVTVALLLPQQGNDTARSSSAVSAAARPEIPARATRPAPVAAQAPPEAIPPATPSLPRPEASRPAAATTDAASATSLTRSFDGPELPLIVTIRDQALVTADERAAGVPKKLVTLFNSSGKPLDLTLTDLNVPTQESSRSRLHLRAGMQGFAGTDSGLNMSAGDELVIQSPGFRDMSITVP